MSMLPVGFGASGDYTIEESLRFNASQSSYLSRTPASTSNRQIMTFSFWMKRGLLTYSANYLNLFTAYPGSSAIDVISFSPSSDSLRVWFNGSSSADLITTQVFRDPSAWYHVVVAIDTTQATPSNRIKVYVNGSQITSFSTATYPSQNYNTYWNSSSYASAIGANLNGPQGYFDGYLTEVNFIDGQALDPSSFGETDATTGVWKPKGYTGTYGTNGFYLPMKLDNTVEGFNTVTWVGTGSTQQIRGVGFSPDLVWGKNRGSAASHQIVDSIRGASNVMFSDATSGDSSRPLSYKSFDTDGFTLGSGTDGNINTAGNSYVAWCWDAGSSTVSNTDGSITSSVRANPTYGFSVVSWSGNSVNGSTVGHGLATAPSILITKSRTNASSWVVGIGGISGFGVNDYLTLQTTNAKGSSSTFYQAYDSSTFTVGVSAANELNKTGNNYVTYCFAEVSGYSKFGSYTGTGASGNVVTTGFKPAFVMIKRTDSIGNWFMFDSTRDAGSTGGNTLWANYSNAEDNGGSPLYPIEYTDTGFVIQNGSDPNASGGTYIYMAFKDTREYAFWLDDSGNNNDWQPNGGITTSSTVTDTPTPYADGGNYAVLNPINRQASSFYALSDGNLRFDYTVSGSDVPSYGTVSVSSGKWYFEGTYAIASGVGARAAIGITSDVNAMDSLGNNPASFGYRESGAKNSTAGGLQSYGASYAVNDIIGVALDMDAGTVTFFKNGVSQGVAFSGLSGSFTLGVCGFTPCRWIVNFGQRPFAYTPPTGFKALHTGNLPDSSIVDGSKYFNAITYTGTGASVARTGVGFQPDLVWYKSRSVTENHQLFDVVRGVQKSLYSNLTNAETTDPGVYSFDSDGFTAYNSAYTYVAWNWKANGTGVTNTDGSITSTVSANPTAGFSVVNYVVPSGGAVYTVGHGLGSAPKMIISKARNEVGAWLVYAPNFTKDEYLLLNTTGAKGTATDFWGSAVPTSSVFGGKSGFTWNAGVEVINYCFAEVEGYSKFGSYTGNGSADGPFVFCGFRPRYVMVKRSNAIGNWQILDTARSVNNVSNANLYANLSNAEVNGGNEDMDILSNGWKPRNASASFNISGSTYIYMAFAEVPFSKALAR